MDKLNQYDNPQAVSLAKFIYERDPAATSWQEVYDLYPGFKAVANHFEAHRLYKEGDVYEARKLSEQSRTQTGIEIHPGAQIGENLFIDHGMGVVIGETAIVGDNVKMYHGVTLGGTGSEKGRKRHPTIQDDVEIGANATLLGNITIGHHAKVGAGAVVLVDVPPYATAVGVPARIILHDKNWNRIGEYQI
ncbi:serine O-acetyltransferase EpsC [Aerococcaceae bacterium WGS1372]